MRDLRSSELTSPVHGQAGASTVITVSQHTTQILTSTTLSGVSGGRGGLGLQYKQIVPGYFTPTLTQITGLRSKYNYLITKLV